MLCFDIVLGLEETYLRDGNSDGLNTGGFCASKKKNQMNAIFQKDV